MFKSYLKYRNNVTKFRRFVLVNVRSDNYSYYYTEMHLKPGKNY